MFKRQILIARKNRKSNQTVNMNTTEEIDWKKKNVTVSFMDPKTTHDRVLIVDQTKFYIPVQLLSVWSEFFETLFNGNFKESNETEIPIEGVSPSDFNMFLLAIYPTRQKVTAQNLSTMIDLSFRFLAPGVLAMCRELIDTDFNNLDKIELLEISFQCEFDNIMERSATFIKNQLEVKGSVYTCKMCRKSKNFLGDEVSGNNFANHLGCPNCGSYGSDAETKPANFMLFEGNEYFNENKSKFENMSNECRAYLFGVLLGV